MGLVFLTLSLFSNNPSTALFCCRVFCYFLSSQLELSLPKFSMSSMTDLRELLANMAAEVEDRLLGSEAEFDRLSSSKPFTIDKVSWSI